MTEATRGSLPDVLLSQVYTNTNINTKTNTNTNTNTKTKTKTVDMND